MGPEEGSQKQHEFEPSDHDTQLREESWLLVPVVLMHLLNSQKPKLNLKQGLYLKTLISSLSALTTKVRSPAFSCIFTLWRGALSL